MRLRRRGRGCAAAPAISIFFTTALQHHGQAVNMITLDDLRNVISFGEHTAMLELDGKDELNCSFVEITEDLFDADYFYICKRDFNPVVYSLLFLTLLEELKPAKGITDDNYEALRKIMRAKLGFIIYWKIGKVKKFLLQL